MYNVLEKARVSPLPSGRGQGEGAVQDVALRAAPSSGAPRHLLPAGEKREPLTPAEQDIFDRAFILILKKLHDDLDDAVADAYGWPRDLADEEILVRLVALNKARAAEERQGLVRWLRPDYQIPRFGSQTEKAQLEAELVGGAGDGMTQTKDTAKPKFPVKDIEQTLAVTMALVRSASPLSAAEIARGFKEGRKIEKRVEFTLKALSRMGELSSVDYSYTTGAVSVRPRRFPTSSGSP